jgi:O-antigen ligase
MTFSALSMMTLMMLGALLLYSRRDKRLRWLLAAGLIIGAAFVLAFTKTMWIGAAAGATWLLWWKNKWLAAPLPVLAAIVFVTNPFHVLDRDRDHRAALRRAGWEMIQAHPLVGVGPEQVGPQFMDYLPADVARPIPKEWYVQHLHNIYIHFAAERGLPALAALLWLLGQSMFDFFRVLKRLPDESDDRWILHGAIAVVIAIAVSGWGEVNVGHSQVLEMFLAVIACGYVTIGALRSDSLKAGR